MHLNIYIRIYFSNVGEQTHNYSDQNVLQPFLPKKDHISTSLYKFVRRLDAIKGNIRF